MFQKNLSKKTLFFRDVHDMIKVNPQFETKIEVDLLKYSIEKWKGVKAGACLYL